MVSPFLKQAWTASAVHWNMVGQGMVLSYSSVLLPGLMAPGSTIKVDLDSASWLASIIGISSMFGFLLSSYGMEKYGRRRVHMMTMIPGTLGLLLIYFARNVPTLMVGRFLGGITGGATVTLGAVVIGEYSAPEHRGMFLNLKTAAVCLGGMATHVLGHYFDWRTVAAIGVLPNFIGIGIICTWPESPAWLVSNHQYEKAEYAFFWLRGRTQESAREFEALIKTHKDLGVSGPSGFKNSVGNFFNKFTKKDFLKPLTIIFFASILIESSGRHVFPAYALDIIQSVTGDKSNAFYYTLCIDLITTVSSVFSSVLVKLMKRRTLLFGSGLVAMIVLLAACLCLYLISHDIMSQQQSWVAISLFIVYFVFSNLGCTPIPLALLGELFPLAHRGVGSGVSGVCMSINVLIALKTMPFMMASIDVYGTFAVLCGMSIFVLIVLYFTLPETKDRTLGEIEYYFNHGRYNDGKPDEAELDTLKGQDKIVTYKFSLSKH